MAVPTKEEFDAWLALATAPIEVGASLPDDPNELTVDHAADYLRQADADQNQRWRDMLASPAWQWMHGQREFLRAYDRVFQVSRRKNRHDPGPSIDRFRALAQSIFDRSERRRARRILEGPYRWFAEEERRMRELREEIERGGKRAFGGIWRVDLMRAVAEYLAGEAAASFRDAAAEIEAAAKAAQDAVTRYRQLAEVVNEARFLGIRAKGMPVQRYPIETRIASIGPSPFGVRKDSRADERLFVYRMFVANNRAAGSPKAEAIAELMGLEGFRHQYDTRTIERLCARFRRWNRGLAAWDSANFYGDAPGRRPTREPLNRRL